jgi:transposase InsO family protein
MAEKSLSSSTTHELRRLVDQDHQQLSIRRQCELLGLTKSTLYYKPVPVKAETLRIMVRIDPWYLEGPASGSRSMVDYLAAAVNLYSRYILSWKLSKSLDTEFCLDALEMALGSGRMPRIFHSDQGCQCTSTDFVERLKREGSRSAGRAGSVALTISLSNACGGRSSTRRCI